MRTYTSFFEKYPNNDPETFCSKPKEEAAKSVKKSKMYVFKICYKHQQ